MSTNHTPGPWKLLDNAILSESINYAGNFIVTELSPRADAEHLANARLIAAAPALLEIAIAVARTYPDGPCIKREDMDDLRAAIAKATGA